VYMNDEGVRCDVGAGHRVPWIFLCVSSAEHRQQQSAAEGRHSSRHSEWSSFIVVAIFLSFYYKLISSFHSFVMEA